MRCGLLIVHCGKNEQFFDKYQSITNVYPLQYYLCIILLLTDVLCYKNCYKYNSAAIIDGLLNLNRKYAW